jgi:hypothetical protein
MSARTFADAAFSESRTRQGQVLPAPVRRREVVDLQHDAEVSEQADHRGDAERRPRHEEREEAAGELERHGRNHDRQMFWAEESFADAGKD